MENSPPGIQIIPAGGGPDGFGSFGCVGAKADGSATAWGVVVRDKSDLESKREWRIAKIIATENAASIAKIKRGVPPGLRAR